MKNKNKFRQTVLFTATMPPQVERYANAFVFACMHFPYQAFPQSTISSVRKPNDADSRERIFVDQSACTSAPLAGPWTGYVLLLRLGAWALRSTCPTIMFRLCSVWVIFFLCQAVVPLHTPPHSARWSKLCTSFRRRPSARS